MKYFCSGFISLAILFGIYITGYTQEKLFIPLEIQDAYEAGTRSKNGSPGENYWQNSADYILDARLFPKTGILSGKGRVTYFNKSPHTLNYIVFKLYQDVFRKGSERLREISQKDIHKGTEFRMIKINSQRVDSLFHETNMLRQNANLEIKLDEALAPEDSITFEFEWRFRISQHTNIRMGRYDSTSYFIAYWYPQIAVFDDIHGWDRTGYDGLHEAYFDFNNFEVDITVPKNFIVWATGNPKNTGELLSLDVIKNYSKIYKSKNVVHVIDSTMLNNGNLTIDKDTLTWRYSARNIPDFCFATSDHFLWDALVYKNIKNKNILIHAAYLPTSKDYKEVAEISKRTIEYFETTMPAMEFPFSQVTIFNGNDGMEFPMMINARSNAERYRTVALISHELAHMYFPFLVGVNQTKYSWMDEMMAQFIPAEYQTKEEPSVDQAARSSAIFSYYSGTELEMPMMVPSEYLRYYEYYIASYYRPEIALRILESMLGKEIFLKALQTFIHNWSKKHPSPYDFFFTFEAVSGKDLTWFWEPWFFQHGYPDLAIENAEVKRNKLSFRVRKKGRLPVPLRIVITNQQNEQTEIVESAEIWKINDVYSVKTKIKGDLKAILVGDYDVPDINWDDNVIEFDKKK